MKKIISILIVLTSLQTVFAINVEGRIVDKDTNEPIIDAVLLALSNNKLLTSANSDAKGNFRISLKKGKNIHLEVVKNGYKTESADVFIDQAFIDAKPFITIKLQKKDAITSEELAKLEKNDDVIMEDIGSLDDLPKGSKIIEAVPIKENDYKKSKFNVTPESRDQKTNVNVEVLKSEYNKDLLTDALKPNFNFTTSYYKDGSIYFNVAKAFLSDEVKTILKGIAQRLKSDTKTILKMTIFADAKKEAKIGEYISKLRTESIVNYLINEGVEFRQLDVNIIGNQMVKNDCTEGVECTEEQHQENRKVELVFVK